MKSPARADGTRASTSASTQAPTKTAYGACQRKNKPGFFKTACVQPSKTRQGKTHADDRRQRATRTIASSREEQRVLRQPGKPAGFARQLRLVWLWLCQDLKPRKPAPPHTPMRCRAHGFRQRMGFCAKSSRKVCMPPTTKRCGQMARQSPVKPLRPARPPAHRPAGQSPPGC